MIRVDFWDQSQMAAVDFENDSNGRRPSESGGHRDFYKVYTPELSGTLKVFNGPFFFFPDFVTWKRPPGMIRLQYSVPSCNNNTNMITNKKAIGFMAQLSAGYSPI